MSWRKSRKIIERIIVEGDLILLTPTSLGNGDSDGLTDMSLLLDEVGGKALLTGTSIAGALRNYLRERLLNFEVSEESQFKDKTGKRLKDASGNNLSLPIVTKLFGSLEEDGSQSYLIIDDALSSEKPTTEFRDGVRIDGKTRTAKDGAKFDLELLESGTVFNLRFELLICEQKGKTDEETKANTANFRENLVSAFATALQGFEQGEIHIGARKRRGYGECKIENWKVQRFDLATATGLLEWLEHDTNSLNVPAQDSISTALNSAQITDARAFFELNACFAIDGSMLIRSGSKLPNISGKGQPDTVHLRSNGKPVLSGTSLAGALRHRAVKICNTLKDDSGEKFVENFFGADMEKIRERNKANKTKEKPFASRLEIREKVITNTNDLVQTRVKIDRFTSGAFEGALFDAAPVFAQTDEKAVEISLKLRKPNDAEIGLLLLLLKDLWTSDLAVGGESSIGRGRLKGKNARLKFGKNDEIFLESETDEKVKDLTDGEMERLNNFVNIFNRKIKEEQSSGTED